LSVRTTLNQRHSLLWSLPLISVDYQLNAWIPLPSTAESSRYLPLIRLADDLLRFEGHRPSQ
jgi:hypothetical protein